MSGNKIKKKQVDFIPYTTDANEFTTLNPTGSPALPDRILLEDTSNSNIKFSATLQDVANLISTSASLPYYQYFNDDNIAVVVNNTSTGSTVLTGTTSSLVDGTYKISWSYFWNSAKLLKDFIAEILVDGVVKRTHVQTNSEGGNSSEFGITCSDLRIPSSGFFCMNLAAGIHTLEIRVRTEDLTYQVSIWDRTIDIQRVI
jgi:hypothetical protein